MLSTNILMSPGIISTIFDTDQALQHYSVRVRQLQELALDQYG